MHRTKNNKTRKKKIEKKIHRKFIQICYMTKGNKRELEEDKFDKFQMNQC